jgi:hypothetical protein
MYNSNQFYNNYSSPYNHTQHVKSEYQNQQLTTQTNFINNEMFQSSSYVGVMQEPLANSYYYQPYFNYQYTSTPQYYQTYNTGQTGPSYTDSRKLN